MKLDAPEGRELMVARKSAIRTQKQAAMMLGRNTAYYNDLEQHQEKARIHELKTIFDAVGTDGKDTIKAWLNGMFGTAEED